MNSVSTAKKLGLLYFLLAAATIFDQFYLTAGFSVSGDPAATAQNILNDEFRYRLSMLLGFVGQILSTVMVIGLYGLFRDVNKRLALMMLVFWVMGSVLMLSTLSTKLLTLALVHGGDSFSAFTKSQLDSLSFVISKFRTAGMTFVIGFWGLWLFPFGRLIIISRMLPPLLGYALYLAGSGYVISTVLSIAFPDVSKMISPYLMPLYFGELPIIFWLMLKGVREPEPRPV